MTSTLCPCGSTQDYNACCGLTLEGTQKASTPEMLMRARYTAFTLGKIDFIKATSRGKALRQFDETAARDWAAEATWLGLEILKATPVKPNDTVAYVEFVAACEEHGKRYQAHERSRFEKYNGDWYYVDGLALSEDVEEEEHVHTDACQHDHHHTSAKAPARSTKVGRNDNCPCGSGQKYKKCCGRAH